MYEGDPEASVAEVAHGRSSGASQLARPCLAIGARSAREADRCAKSISEASRLAVLRAARHARSLIQDGRTLITPGLSWRR